MKFGFVAKHRGAWPVLMMFEALGVSRSGFMHGSSDPEALEALTTNDWAAWRGIASSPAIGRTVLAACGEMCWRPANAAACIGLSG